MSTIKPVTYIKILEKHFTLDEIRALSMKLNVDFENFPYSNKSDGIREFIAYLLRRRRLDELQREMFEMKPILADRIDFENFMVERDEAMGDERISTIQLNLEKQLSLVTMNSEIITNNDIISTQIELTSVQQQFNEVRQIIQQENSAFSEQITRSIEEIDKTLKVAYSRTEELKADLIPPSVEDRKIRLIPEHHINRLEEYRSDENIFYLLIGLFAGGAISIIVNWTTNDTFNPNTVSLIFFGLLTVFTLICIAWLYRIHNRTKSIINQIFPERQKSPPQSDQ